MCVWVVAGNFSIADADSSQEMLRASVSEEQRCTQAAAFALKFGALFEAHSPSVPWFDAVIMLRKLLALLLLEFIDNPVGQSLAVLSLSVLYLALVCWRPPFRRLLWSSNAVGCGGRRFTLDVSNFMERAATVCVALVFLSSALVALRAVGPESGEECSFLVTVVGLVFVLLLPVLLGFNSSGSGLGVSSCCRFARTHQLLDNQLEFDDPLWPAQLSTTESEKMGGVTRQRLRNYLREVLWLRTLQRCGEQRLDEVTRQKQQIKRAHHKLLMALRRQVRISQDGTNFPLAARAEEMRKALEAVDVSNLEVDDVPPSQDLQRE